MTTAPYTENGKPDPDARDDERNVAEAPVTTDSSTVPAPDTPIDEIAEASEPEEDPDTVAEAEESEALTEPVPSESAEPVESPESPVIKASTDQEADTNTDSASLETVVMPAVVSPPATVVTPGAAPAADRDHWLDRWQLPILAATILVLIVALVGAALWATKQIERRDQTIAELDQLVADLGDVNVALQADLEKRTTEHEALQAAHAELSAEHEALGLERDELSAERDELQAQLGEVEGRAAQLEADLAEQGRQLSQAREETSRQESRAEFAEVVTVILLQVVDIDNEIHYQFSELISHFSAMHAAFERRNMTAYNAAYGRAENTIATLDRLFAQRNALLDELR